ncbi:MAG: ADP-ribosylation factor-like protein [Candidatus Eisenbacteria bacterium]|nr:ADP-ribosylation factor-like protein [Candidatus Eisenbacteria bacterium]
MSLISYPSREINCKVVYYGPGLGGKTTNLRHVYSSVPSTRRGNLVSLATEGDRTLFFDFLPIDVGNIGGFKVRFHLYTVPGQIYYRPNRKLVLRGADGVVFVADSQRERLEVGLESLRDLYLNLVENEIDADKIPLVFQYNKRDAPSALSMQMLEEAFNAPRSPSYEAIACRGVGVPDTLKAICKLVVRTIQ